MEKKTENIRISLTDSIILMLVIIAEIVFCVRGGLNLAVPLLLTWLIIFLSCKIHFVLRIPGRILIHACTPYRDMQ